MQDGIRTACRKEGRNIVIDTTKIEIIMADRCLTQKELAERYGIATSTIRTVLKRGSCTTKTAGTLAAALGISVRDIIKDSTG